MTATFHNGDDQMTAYVSTAYNGTDGGYCWVVRLVDDGSGRTVGVRRFPYSMGKEACALAREWAFGKGEPISVNLG